jgi:hypothetical protein
MNRSPNFLKGSTATNIGHCRINIGITCGALHLYQYFFPILGK